MPADARRCRARCWRPFPATARRGRSRPCCRAPSPTRRRWPGWSAPGDRRRRRSFRRRRRRPCRRTHSRVRPAARRRGCRPGRAMPSSVSIAASQSPSAICQCAVSRWAAMLVGFCDRNSASVLDAAARSPALVLRIDQPERGRLVEAAVGGGLVGGDGGGPLLLRGQYVADQRLRSGRAGVQPREALGLTRARRRCLAGGEQRADVFDRCARRRCFRRPPCPAWPGSGRCRTGRRRRGPARRRGRGSGRPSRAGHPVRRRGRRG